MTWILKIIKQLNNIKEYWENKKMERSYLEYSISPDNNYLYVYAFFYLSILSILFIYVIALNASYT